MPVWGDSQSVGSNFPLSMILVYSRMHRAEVAKRRQTTLETMTGRPADSGLSNEGATPGGGGSMPATSRRVTAVCGIDAMAARTARPSGPDSGGWDPWEEA